MFTDTNSSSQVSYFRTVTPFVTLHTFCGSSDAPRTLVSSLPGGGGGGGAGRPPHFFPLPSLPLPFPDYAGQAGYLVSYRRCLLIRGNSVLRGL